MSKKRPFRLAKRPILLMVIGILVFLVVVLLIFAVRGEIRNRWVPSQVNRFYGPSINRTFDRTFVPLNAVVQPDIAIRKQTPPGDICREGYFRGLAETVQCGLTAQGTIKATPVKQAQWLRNAPNLREYLLSHGWKRDSESQGNVDLDQIFNLNNAMSASTYVLAAGQEQCSFEAMYDSIKYDNPPAAAAPYLQTNALTIYESCDRDVKFFGGDYEP